MNAASRRKAQPGAQASGRPPRRRVQEFGKVESSVPGRTRLRLKPELRTPEAIAEVQQELNRHEDVDDVSINPRTGSVLVTHARHRGGEGILAEALQECGLLAAEVLDLPVGEAEGGSQFSKVDQQLARLVYRIDYAVWRKTRLHFRGHILAGSLAGLGIAHIALYGISLEVLPGPLLLWMAWDIFHRVAQEPPFPDEADDAAAQRTTPRRSRPRPSPRQRAPLGGT